MPKPDFYTPDELDAIERKYPRPEVRALVAEIRRLNAIASHAANFLTQASPEMLDTLPATPRAILMGLRERLEVPPARRARRHENR